MLINKKAKWTMKPEQSYTFKRENNTDMKSQKHVSTGIKIFSGRTIPKHISDFSTEINLNPE
jgi:hypothetical protein